jgi:hypothetical protein
MGGDYKVVSQSSAPAVLAVPRPSSQSERFKGGFRHVIWTSQKWMCFCHNHSHVRHRALIHGTTLTGGHGKELEPEHLNILGSCFELKQNMK